MSQELEAYTVETFCLMHSISRGAFYKLRKSGKTPKLYFVGRRPYISREAAKEWRELMQSEYAA